MSKRRRGFPSETNVKRGVRIVHGHKELTEKLGRDDLCLSGHEALANPTDLPNNSDVSLHPDRARGSFLP